MIRRVCRKLALEVLERRDLLAVVRLASWNTFNLPNDAVSDDDFSTVLAAIGDETVAGNTKRIDLLALQETDLLGSGSDSIGRIESILDTLYPTTDYASIFTSEDGGGDSTGFLYDAATLSLLDVATVQPQTLTHTVMRAKFRPAASTGEFDFFVYSVHLKSGDDGASESQRAIEAALLRSDADQLGEGANVLMVGDFNLFDSFESAYENLTSGGAGQLIDPADAPGSWSDNGAFKSLHSQNPRNSMDDRFDLQLASGELFDDVGIDYIDGSYRVFGNNGTHTLNDAITTGSGADPAVLAALVNASDHLPVVVDYETIASTPRVRIVETGESTAVVEGGLIDSYRVVLDTIPSASVVVTLSPDSQIDLATTTQLTFTPDNALTPQTVIVSAANDAVGEGNHSGAIAHAVASGDLDYNGLAVDGIAVNIVDDDAPSILINELDSDTVSLDTLEFIELYDGGVGNVSLDGLTLVFFNGNFDEEYRQFDLTGFSTGADGLFVVGNDGVAGRDLALNNNNLQNGADAVALYAGSFPDRGAVTTANLLDAVVYGTSDADDAGLLVLLEGGQPQIDEDQRASSEFDSIARNPDHGVARQTETYAVGLPTPGALNAPAPAGVSIVHSAGRVDVAEGGQVDEYQIVLDTLPTDLVTVTVAPDAQTDLGSGPGAPIILDFTPSDAYLPQMVLVAAVDDAAIEGDHVSVIAHASASDDPRYDAIVVPSVVANVADNEPPFVPRIVISEIMYNPASNEVGSGIAEWIEIVNVGPSPTDVGNWLFDDEDAAAWGALPTSTVLDPGQAAVIFDADFTDAATFRTEWDVPTTSALVGVSWGSLANSPSETNEILSLLDALGAEMDIVNFDDAAPWPSDSPDGASIYLTQLLADNNDGSAWGRSDDGNPIARSPSGPTFLNDDSGSPGRAPALADFNGNGRIAGRDFLSWQRGLSAPSATKPDGDADNDTDVDAADLAIWKSQYGIVADWASDESTTAASSAESRASLMDLAIVDMLDFASDRSERMRVVVLDPAPHDPVVRRVLDPEPIVLFSTKAESQTARRRSPRDVAERHALDRAIFDGSAIR